MKSVFVVLLALSSVSVFAQRYGGSTYYGYGEITMAWEKVSQTKVKYGSEVSSNLYVQGSTDIEITNKYLCINGIVTYGNPTTNMTNDYDVRGGGVEEDCFQRGSIKVFEAHIAPSTAEGTYSLAGRTNYNDRTDDPEEHFNKINTTRCVKINKLRRQLRRLSKIRGCSEPDVTLIDGHEVNLKY